jgi:hypothetical protein
MENNLTNLDWLLTGLGPNRISSNFGYVNQIATLHVWMDSHSDLYTGADNPVKRIHIWSSRAIENARCNQVYTDNLQL